MATIKALVLRAPGINCDEETAFAWDSVGAQSRRVHINELIESPSLLDRFQVMAVPGGFSYGDDISSGRILGNQLRHHLGDNIRRFVDRGGLVIGICNGFQVLVRMGLLPGEDSPVKVTLTLNETGRYEDRWVYLRGETDRCPFVERGAIYHVPVAHGEGRIVTENGQDGAAQLNQAGRIALRYVTADGSPADFPANPNGSIENIAGLTDSTGRVFGLMPHPERSIFATQPPITNPVFNPENADSREADGIRMFRSAVSRLK